MTKNLLHKEIQFSNFGAQILELKDSNFNDILFLSKIILDKKSSRRGGIPIIFPNFGEHLFLPKHGFARISNWDKDQSIIFNNMHQRYILRINSENIYNWKFDAILNLEYFIQEKFLEIILTITNIGNTSFSWTGGLHPYFKIFNKNNFKIKGLFNSPYVDRYNNKKSEIEITSKPFERLYQSSSSIELLDEKYNILLESEGFNEWMIWNPGEELASNIKDLEINTWNKFICIEPVIVSSPNWIIPGESFIGKLKIKLK